jgi:predicted metal-dependent hydrolase
MIRRGISLNDSQVACYPRLEFKTGRLTLIVPKGYGDEENLLEKKKEWILKRALEIDSAKSRARQKGGSEGSGRDVEEMRVLVERLISEYRHKADGSPNKVFFKSMRTKWGSCSKKGNLTFNTYLSLLPERLIRYVVFHEMLHLRRRKHSEDFWRRLEAEFQDAGEHEKELLEYWFYIQESRSQENPTVRR